MGMDMRWLAALGTSAMVGVGVILGCAPLGTTPPSDAAALACSGVDLQGDQRNHTVVAGDCFGGGNAYWSPTVNAFSTAKVCLTCIRPLSDRNTDIYYSTCQVKGYRGTDQNSTRTGEDQIAMGQSQCYDVGAPPIGTSKWIETLGSVQIQSVSPNGGGGTDNIGLRK